MSQAASPLAHPVVLRCLTPLLLENDLSCGLRLVNKDIAEQLRDCTSVKLSQPTPPDLFRAYWGAAGRMRSMPLHKRREFVRLTAHSGCVANLELAVEVAGLDLGGTSWAMEAAAGAGHTQACAWLRELGCSWGKCLRAAAGGGHAATCSWLLANGCPFDAGARSTAAAKCHEELARGLLAHPPGQPPALASSSAKRGASLEDEVSLLYELVYGAVSHRDLATLQRLTATLLELRGDPDVPRGSRWDPSSPAHHPLYSALEPAACSLTPDWRAKVEWLEAQLQPTPLPADVWNSRHWLRINGVRVLSCPDALDRLAWFASRGHEFRSDTLEKAARLGNLPALQYLLRYFEQRGTAPQKLPSSCTAAAAEAGQVTALRLLLDHGVPAGRSSAMLALRHGHTEVLQLLAERGVRLRPSDVIYDQQMLESIKSQAIPWLVETAGMSVARRWNLLDRAAAEGNVEILAWLRARGFPWGLHLWRHGCSTLIAAIEGGCEEAIEWLLENDCPAKVDDRKTYAQVARQGDLAMLRYCLQRRGLPFDRQALFRSCVKDSEVGLATIRWLVQEMDCGPGDWGPVLEEARAAKCPGAKLAWLEAEAARQAGGGAQAGAE